MSVDPERDYQPELPEAAEAPEYPAMEKSGRSPTWEKVKYIAKKVGVMALKGAVIGGLALGTLALLPGGIAGAVGLLPGATTVLKLVGMNASNWLVGGALYGATVGAIAGTAVGMAQGFGDVDEAMDDMEQSIVTRGQRAQQLAASQQTFAAGLERLRASQQGAGMVQAQPQLPYGANMGVGRGGGM